MSTLDLGRIERQAWQAYHEDGLMDIAFGSLLLFVYVGSTADRLHWGAIVALLLVWGAIVALLLVGPALALAKRMVTAPRLGSVEFSTARKGRKRRVVLFIAAAVAASTLIPFVLGGEEWLRSHNTVVSFGLGVLVFTVFAAVAYWLDLRRMYGVGVLFGGAFTIAELLGTPLPMLIAGSIVALSGTARLIIFLRRYPRQAVGNVPR
jgi:MFS family permease